MEWIIRIIGVIFLSWVFRKVTGWDEKADAFVDSIFAEPPFGEKEKESVRRAYDRLKKVAEMTKQYPVNGRYMQVFLDDEKLKNSFVNFEVHVGYEYETPLLKQMRNIEGYNREVVLYNHFRETPYEEGADCVTKIVFGKYDTLEFVVFSVMDAQITRRQIIDEFKTLGIHEVSVEKSFTSFRMY